MFSPCLKRLLSEPKVDAFSPKLSGLVERFGARASSRSPSSSRSLPSCVQSQREILLRAPLPSRLGFGRREVRWIT